MTTLLMQKSDNNRATKKIGQSKKKRPDPKKNNYPVADCRLGLKTRSKSQIIFVILRVVCRITYWESQIFAICYGWAQISGTVPPKESNGSSGGSRGGNTIPLARQGCVTGVVVVVIIVLVTVSAYVAEAVPDQIVAVAAVVAGVAARHR